MCWEEEKWRTKCPFEIRPFYRNVGENKNSKQVAHYTVVYMKGHHFPI